MREKKKKREERVRIIFLLHILKYSKQISFCSLFLLCFLKFTLIFQCLLETKVEQQQKIFYGFSHINTHTHTEKLNNDQRIKVTKNQETKCWKWIKKE